MYKLLVLSLGALQVLLSLTVPATAQKVASSELDHQCQAAVQSARSKLENNRDLRIKVSIYNQADRKAEYPKDRPLFVSLLLDGGASESVMNSPQMMKAISAEVIMKCESVSVVSIGINGTDWFVTYGLMSETRVEEFKCLSSRDIPEHVPYGYRICL